MEDLLKTAIRENNVVFVEVLLNFVDPSFDSNWAICMASAYGHTEIVRLLLQDGRVEPTAIANYPIRWAATYGYLEIVKLLLERRVYPVAGLIAANEANQITIIEYLKNFVEPRVFRKIVYNIDIPNLESLSIN